MLRYEIILTFAFAILYCKAAYIEGASPLLWTGLSFVVSFLAKWSSFGLIGIIIGQVVLFFAIAIVRAAVSFWKERKDANTLDRHQQ